MRKYKSKRKSFITGAVLLVLLCCDKMASGEMITLDALGGPRNQVRMTWPDGPYIGTQYGNNYCGLSSDGAVAGVSGGIAIKTTDLTGYLHSTYFDDTQAAVDTTLRILVDGALVFEATGQDTPVLTGSLAVPGTSHSGQVVRTLTRGTFHTIDADFAVEREIDADVPRMMYSKMTIDYSKDLEVDRLYHQLLRANSDMMTGEVTMMTMIDGAIHRQDGIKGSELPLGQMNDGLFYVIDGEKYVGFLGDSRDIDFFLMYQNLPNYYASYKTLYDGGTVLAGQRDESRGITCWGNSLDEAVQLLEWTHALRRGEEIDTSELSDTDKQKIQFIQRMLIPEPSSLLLITTGLLTLKLSRIRHW